jgi:hypothetical protein
VRDHSALGVDGFTQKGEEVEARNKRRERNGAGKEQKSKKQEVTGT